LPVNKTGQDKEKTMNKEPLPNEDTISREELHGHIKSAVSKLGSKLSKEEKSEHAKLLVNIFEKGMTPKEAMKISDQEMAQIYSYAYHQFSGGKYEEARELFKMLLTLEPQNSNFATALGVCHHRLKAYEYALYCYMLSSVLAPTDPVPLFYAYDCFMNTNDEVSAGVILCSVIARAGDQPQYAQIKADAQLRLEPLQKKIVEGQAAE